MWWHEVTKTKLGGGGVAKIWFGKGANPKPGGGPRLGYMLWLAEIVNQNPGVGGRRFMVANLIEFKQNLVSNLT